MTDPLPPAPITGRVRDTMAALERVLAVDGSGVALLSGSAVAAAVRDRTLRSGDARRLAATAAVGAAGFALAVVAVGRVRNPRQAQAEPGSVRVSLQLIAAGAALNTVGCMLSAVVSRGRMAPSVAAVTLLVGGDILSALYAHRLIDLRGEACPRRQT